MSKVPLCRVDEIALEDRYLTQFQLSDGSTKPRTGFWFLFPEAKSTLKFQLTQEDERDQSCILRRKEKMIKHRFVCWQKLLPLETSTHETGYILVRASETL